MPRIRSTSLPADVSQFSGLQLHPRTLITLGLNASAGWLRDHAISHRELLREHRIGFVFWGADLSYKKPLRYFEADTLEIRAEARSRKRGAQLELTISYVVDGTEVARLVTCSVPLWIAEEDELSGLPAPMGEALIARFQPDEIEETPYVSPVPELLGRLAREGTLLATREERLFMHRQHCEFADQWYFGVTPDFCGIGRERLALVHGDDTPLVRKGLSLPIKDIHMMFERPYALFDHGTIETRAYAFHDAVAFVHRLLGERGDLHATAIELF